MHSKALKTVLLIGGFATLAAFAGFGLGRMSQGNDPLVIYGERARAEHLRSIVRHPDLEGIDPRVLEQFGNLSPLVKAGRLTICLNEATGDYAVFDERDPIAYKTTKGDETTMSYYGVGGYVSIDLTYKRGTTELLGCVFMTTDGGIFGPTKHYYSDYDGDGRFDRLSDRRAGKFCDLKDLQWVLIDSTQLRDKDE